MTVHTIMTTDESGSKLVEFAQQVAGQLVRNNLARAQIRNIFTEVRQIETMWSKNSTDALRRLMMLKPKLAYQTARTNSMEQLSKVLTEAIDEVEKSPQQNDAFKRFVDLFEAILAYHRALGGRN